MSTITTMASASISSTSGIGIVHFLEGKNFFITGATGFLGKVLVEKMLRTITDVGTIFLLIKAKDQEAALQRLETEIIDSELFKCLKEIHGKSYKDFMMKKLVPVMGNVCEFNLGIDAVTASEITKEVDVIVNSAANTTFDERYEVILNTNTQGPTRLLDFAKKCKRLTAFLHFSTAYVSGDREGIILEKPLCMEKIIGEGKITSEPSTCFVSPLDVNDEIKLAGKVVESHRNDEVAQAQQMKDLGMERAKIYGWRNSYEMAKAMGEMLLIESKITQSFPTVIVRPSIIGSTYAEPFQGWIQGNRMLDPVILSYGQGRLPGFIGNPSTTLDFVPVDMVANAAIAAMAMHGIAGKSELHVYHIGSSVENPVSLQSCFNFFHDHFTTSPLLYSKEKKIGIAPMKIFGSMDSFSNYIRNEIILQSGFADNVLNLDPNLHLQIQMEWNKRLKRYMRLAQLYEPYMFYKGRYDVGNTKKLMECMSAEEVKMFGFDVGTINWKHYFEDIHVPGLRRHVVKEPSKRSSPTSRI